MQLKSVKSVDTAFRSIINRKFAKIIKKYLGIFMLRFAFSPSNDMHVGDLRIAIFNYLSAKKRGENFIVRIDDSKKEDIVKGVDQEMLDLLGLFQIEYTQVIHQSQNFKFHAAMALQLLHEKKAFSCFCSDEWLEKKYQEAKTLGKDYYYDDACRNLPAELVIDNTAPFRVRIVRPHEMIIVNDKIQGCMNFTPDDVDSFVIMNQDKTPTGDFASAIDDMLNDISLVISDVKYMEHIPKQIHIRDQLTYEKKIEYAHLPMLINEKEFSIKLLLEQGYLPEAILNYLILIQNDTPKEIFTLQEALEWFTLDTIINSPASFEITKLQEINKEHMKRMNATELSRYVGFADAEIGELARIYLDEVSTTRELKKKIEPIFQERDIPDALKKDVEALKKVIVTAPYCDSYDEFKTYILHESGIEESCLEKPLRLLLTNSEDGPEISKIYKYLKNYIGEITK